MYKFSFNPILALLLIASLALSCSAVIANEQTSKTVSYQLVTHPDLKLNSFERRELRNIFTLRRSVWPNGQSIQLVVLNTDSKIHEQFTEKHLGLLTYQVDRVWKRQIFSGAGLKPIEVDDFKQVIELVAKTPGAIGYVLKTESQELSYEKVKVINLSN